MFVLQKTLNSSSHRQHCPLCSVLLYHLSCTSSKFGLLLCSLCSMCFHLRNRLEWRSSWDKIVVWDISPAGWCIIACCIGHFLSFLFCRIKVSAKKLSLKKLWQVHLQQEAITTKKQARCISDKIQLVINTATIKPSAVVSSGVVLQQSGGVDSKCQVSIAQS